jgi:DNA-directed RNA polymerase subunit N
MMVPVRCFTCGKVIGQAWEDFKRRSEEGEDPGKVMDKLGIRRYCCRQIFVGNTDLISEIDKFKP